MTLFSAQNARLLPVTALALSLMLTGIASAGTFASLFEGKEKAPATEAAPKAKFGASKPEPAANAMPARNYLPPVAVINPPLDSNTPQVEQPDELETVALSAVTSKTLELRPRITKLDSQLNLSKAGDAAREGEVQALLDLQQDLDKTDLNNLWAATVERNPVIRFSLDKMNTPVDLQPKKSSEFSKRILSTMIQTTTMGAMLVPGVGSGYQNMAISSLGQAANNMVMGKNKNQFTQLSVTEQIQLSALVEELREKLIKNYHNYKQTLMQLEVAHRQAMEANNLYSQSLTTGNDFARLVAGSSYYKAALKETSLREEAKIQRLSLERLAGTDAVSSLQLALFFTSGEKTVSEKQATTAKTAPTKNLQPVQKNEPKKAAPVESASIEKPAEKPAKPLAPLVKPGSEPLAAAAVDAPETLEAPPLPEAPDAMESLMEEMLHHD